MLTTSAAFLSSSSGLIRTVAQQLQLKEHRHSIIISFVSSLQLSLERGSRLLVPRCMVVIHNRIIGYMSYKICYVCIRFSLHEQCYMCYKILQVV